MLGQRRVALESRSGLVLAVVAALGVVLLAGA